MPVLDASVVVSWFVYGDVHSEIANRWALRSQGAGERWNVPAILLTEVAAGMSRVGDPGEALLAVARFARLREVVIYPVTETRAIRSAQLAADLQIRGCDAIYVALAAELGDELVTFDRQQLERARGSVTVTQPM